jgi:hypothetical protein
VRLYSPGTIGNKFATRVHRLNSLTKFYYILPYLDEKKLQRYSEIMNRETLSVAAANANKRLSGAAGRPAFLCFRGISCSCHDFVMYFHCFFSPQLEIGQQVLQLIRLGSFDTGTDWQLPRWRVGCRAPVKLSCPYTAAPLGRSSHIYKSKRKWMNKDYKFNYFFISQILLVICYQNCSTSNSTKNREIDEEDRRVRCRTTYWHYKKHRHVRRLYPTNILS